MRIQITEKEKWKHVHIVLLKRKSHIGSISKIQIFMILAKVSNKENYKTPFKLNLLLCIFSCLLISPILKESCIE